MAKTDFVVTLETRYAEDGRLRVLLAGVDITSAVLSLDMERRAYEGQRMCDPNALIAHLVIRVAEQR